MYYTVCGSPVNMGGIRLDTAECSFCQQYAGRWSKDEDRPLVSAMSFYQWSDTINWMTGKTSSLYKICSTYPHRFPSRTCDEENQWDPAKLGYSEKKLLKEWQLGRLEGVFQPSVHYYASQLQYGEVLCYVRSVCPSVRPTVHPSIRCMPQLNNGAFEGYSYYSTLNSNALECPNGNEAVATSQVAAPSICLQWTAKGHNNAPHDTMFVQCQWCSACTISNWATQKPSEDPFQSQAEM